jgi:hypothetical protein
MTGNPFTDSGDGDRSSQCHQFTYDLDAGELPSHAVVRAVAAITNESALDLEPLYDAIDPEYLNDLFEGPDRGGGPVGGIGSTELSFTFSDFDISVTDEQVRVREMDDRN